ncbi:hypothetical protein SL003B_3425 [Polymorphum gilvum SL003B-26A1]|uniref:Uncharacterized protein n=2 Tax=Polymorphum TaxID=991903 RepID=F2J012_POLGS|nr:hypothetical protein SL003B_3425 [Polymorphum gilvum SL003B-26A1]
MLQALMRQNGAAARALPEDQRSRLAVFCYRKAHLRRLGLEIAATCSARALVEEAGHAGELIFRQSRDPAATLASDTYLTAREGRRPVTLCSYKG